MSLKARDTYECTPLHWAASCYNEHCITRANRCVRLLLDHGAPVNARDENGSTPLNTACKYKWTADIVSMLICAGADINARDRCGFTPLQTACLHRHNHVAQTLIAAGAYVNMATMDGFTLLHMDGLYECGIVDKVIACGAYVNATSRWGDTPLHTACKCGTARDVTLLVNAGANIRVSNDEGCTPLMVAVQARNWETTVALFQLGAPAPTRNLRDFLATCLKLPYIQLRPYITSGIAEISPSSLDVKILFDAVRTGSVFLLRTLFRLGESPFCVNAYERTLLHVACMRQTEKLQDVLLTLVEAGISVHAHDKFGMTPLRSSTSEAKKHLLSLGAHVHPCCAPLLHGVNWF